MANVLSSSKTSTFPHHSVSLLSRNPSLQVILFETKELQCGYEEFEGKKEEKDGSAVKKLKHTTDDINGSFFICPICQLIARDPIETPCCHHWFCAPCYLEYITKPIARDPTNGWLRVKCANCRAFFEGEKTSYISTIHRRIAYSKLTVNCPFSCGFHAFVSQMGKHEEYECPKRPVHCPFPNCAFFSPAEEMDLHLETCLRKCIFCPNCQLPVNSEQFSDHNCVSSLQKALKDEQRCLERYSNHWANPMNQLGPRGELSWCTHYKNDAQPALLAYCARYGKFPPLKNQVTATTTASATSTSTQGARRPISFLSILGSRPNPSPLPGMSSGTSDHITSPLEDPNQGEIQAAREARRNLPSQPQESDLAAGLRQVDEHLHQLEQDHDRNLHRRNELRFLRAQPRHRQEPSPLGRNAPTTGSPESWSIASTQGSNETDVSGDEEFNLSSQSNSQAQTQSSSSTTALTTATTSNTTTTSTSESSTFPLILMSPQAIQEWRNHMFAPNRPPSPI